MRRQVVERLRRAVGAQIGGGGDEMADAGRQLPHDQAGIRDGAVAQDGVEAVGRRIDPPVVELQRQLDARMRRQERDQGRA